MALQASGSISFSQIANEFGLSPNKNFGAYRVRQNVGELLNLPLDDGIPESGIMSFSTFYSKKLNVVMNFNGGSRINAKTSYDDSIVGIVTTIGGYRIRPASSSGTKVWIHVSGTITSNLPSSSSAPNNIYCSLLTGNWDNDTDLRLDIGPSGVVMGIGGDGGGGGGGTGGFGTSAIGVTYQPISIINRGTVLSGTGGGGGGGNSTRGIHRPMSASGGSGGGGRPFGNPGAGLLTNGPGSAGQFVTDDTGGDGSPNFRTLTAGSGGDGGQSGGTGSDGGEFSTVIVSHGSGGAPGASGYAFIISTDGSGVTIDLGANTLGSVTYNISPN